MTSPARRGLQQVPLATPERCLLTVDAPNIILENNKPGEDGSSGIVFRLYEYLHTTTLPARSAVQTDMLENGDPMRT